MRNSLTQHVLPFIPAVVAVTMFLFFDLNFRRRCRAVLHSKHRLKPGRIRPNLDRLRAARAFDANDLLTTA